MNKGFTLIELLIVIAIIGILVAVIYPVATGEKQVINENVENTIDDKSLTDNEILYSRKYVLDFDQRMERANEQIKSCVGSVVDYKILQSCTSTAYNSQGWEVSDYGKGAVLKANIVDDYNKHKFVSMQSLSTEL